MTLIVILAGIGLSVYGNSVQRSKEAVLKEDLFQMRDAIDQYYADKNKYPGNLEDLVSDKYIRSVPVDPFTASADTWQTTMSEPDPGNPTLQSGISNVKSGSDQTGLDGTRYADW
jgi:general secretion pathway protein G